MVYYNGIDIKLLVCVYILSHTRGLQLLLFPLPWFYKCSIGRNSLGCGMDVGSKGAPLSFERCWQCICWSVPICSTGRQCRPADTSFLATSSAPTVEYQGCEWLEEGTQWAYLGTLPVKALSCTYLNDLNQLFKASWALSVILDSVPASAAIHYALCSMLLVYHWLVTFR